MAFALSRQQLKDFFETGFVIVPAVFGADEVAAMRAAFDRLAQIGLSMQGTGDFKGSHFVVARREGGNAIHRINWCGAAEPLLSEYGKDPRLLRMAAEILGMRSFNQLINQAHFKLPGDGVAFPWHQDITHRDKGDGSWRDVNGRGSYVQMLVAVDDNRADNGPLMFIPGTGMAGNLHLGVSGDDDEDYTAGPLNAEAFDPSKAVPAVMAAGSVALFGPYVIHGSEPNRSNKPRRVLINGYACAGANTRKYPGEGAGRLLHI